MHLKKKRMHLEVHGKVRQQKKNRCMPHRIKKMLTREQEPAMEQVRVQVRVEQIDNL